jgi:hypothetical protein
MAVATAAMTAKSAVQRSPSIVAFRPAAFARQQA